jgi:undecaprenyl-diphosphatase
MDVFLFEKINALVGNWKFLDYIGIFLAEYLYYILAVVFLIFVLLKKDLIKNKLLVLVSVLSSVVLARLVITEIIKLVYHSPRPYLVLQTAKKLISENHDFQSFPSGHTTVIFAMAMAIYFYNKKLGIFSFVCAVLMGIARIFVGVHWPIDILGGAVIGMVSALLVDKLISKFSKQ